MPVAGRLEKGHAATERHPRGRARPVAAPPGRQRRALTGPGPGDTPADLPPDPIPHAVLRASLTGRRTVRPTRRHALNTRRAPRSRSFSLWRARRPLGLSPPPRTRAALDGCFSAADPRSPADVPARPPSPRAPSPGGRPPRTCTSSGPTTGTPLRTDGRRRAARRRSVILRGRPALPRRTSRTQVDAHGRHRSFGEREGVGSKTEWRCDDGSEGGGTG